MEDPAGLWTSMAAFLRSLPAQLPEPPKALLVVSAHWETEGFAFTGAAKPALLFDYYGFPPHTYELKYDAPGSPALAARAADLLNQAGVRSHVDASRGLDHGVFVPFKVVFPDAAIPTVEMSVQVGLDPAAHLAAGRALEPLRDEGVLIVGSGMSFHNMRGYRDPRFTAPSEQFDAWLNESAALPGRERAERLKAWQTAPAARLSHPREEHLLPLMVAAGAADGAGQKVFGDLVLCTAISGFRFE